ncbi:MAG: hypothetical protein DRI36_05000, partial [Caldiserica bacterium]
MKILAIRTDRIGDCILTLPAIRLIKKYYPESEVYFMIKSKISPLFYNNPDIKEIIPLSDKASIREVFNKIKNYNFDISINFFVDKITPIAVFLAKIPLRIGPFSKIQSIFLNRRIKQNRKKSIKHEADYNIELLSTLNIPFERVEPKIYILEEEKNSFFRFSGKAEKENFVVIH